MIQLAGDIGTISVGLERHFSRYSLGVLYGIVPSEVSGGPVIETVTLRQTYSFYEWDRINSYFGLNIFHVLGLDYKSEKFRDAPDRYYPIGGIRLLLNLGFNIEVRSRELSVIYFEAGMNDLWILNTFNNRQEVNPTDHVVLGIGFKHRF